MDEMLNTLAQDLSEQIIITPVGQIGEPYIRMARKLIQAGWCKIDDETAPPTIARMIIDNCTTEQIYAIRAALSASGG